MSTERPLVTVVTIFLDAQPFLREAIESVLAQTYERWELVLVDDGSRDGSRAIADEFAGRHAGRIRCIEHPQRVNRGMSASRNAGVRAGGGELVAFLDADDVWLPRRLEMQVLLLSVHPAAALVCGPTRVWYSWTGQEADERRDAVREVTSRADCLYMPPELMRLFLQGRALTPATCSVLVRRPAFEGLGGFEETFRGMFEDQAFFLKAYLRVPIYVGSVALDRYRQHGGSHSAGALRRGEYALDRPSPAQVRFLFWLARYFRQARVTDRRCWLGLTAIIGRIQVHRGAAAVSRRLHRLLAWWYASDTTGGNGMTGGRQ